MRWARFMRGAALGLGLLACPAEQPVDSGRPGARTAARTSAQRWPALPRSSAELEALMAAQARRPVPDSAPDELSAAAVLELIRPRVQQQRAYSGTDAIQAELERYLTAARQAGQSSYLLFGTYHDSPGQLDAFRHLTGPLGLGLSLVAIELFDADGRWADVAPGEQRGDDGVIDAYLATGRRSELRELLRRQQQHNYTAWKYGYLRRVTDLLPPARAGGRALMGCDMATTLQQRLRPAVGSDLDRLRDLHCALALRDKLAAGEEPHQVALLWGQTHLGADRLPRLLPAAAGVLRIYMYGHRQGRAGLEGQLGERLRIAEPLLLPLDAERLVLLLPGPRLAAAVDRVRRRPDGPAPPEQRRRLTVSSTAPGKLYVAGRVLATGGPEPATAELPEGVFSWLFESAELSFTGGVTIGSETRQTLHFDVRQREIRSVER